VAAASTYSTGEHNSLASLPRGTYSDGQSSDVFGQLSAQSSNAFQSLLQGILLSKSLTTTGFMVA